MNCGSAACLLRAVNTDQKVTLRPNNLYYIVSDAEIAVVIRLRLSETLKAGKCGQVGTYYLSDHSLYNWWKFNHSQDRFWHDMTEIHLGSLIGAWAFMCEYMNSAVSMRENVADKMYMRKAYRLNDELDNHVVYIRTS